MSKHKLKARLNVNDLAQLEKQLRKYQHDMFEVKMKQLVEELQNIGVNVCKINASASGRYGTHKMENRVAFTKTIKVDGKGHVIGLVLGEGKPFVVTWYPSGEGMPRNDVVLPLHMIEYGTAGLAVRDYADNLGGKGSMAVSGNENKTDWYFFDAFGKRQVGTAIKPTMPMYKATVEIIEQFNSVVKKVFR